MGRAILVVGVVGAATLKIYALLPMARLIVVADEVGAAILWIYTLLPSRRGIYMLLTLLRSRRGWRDIRQPQWSRLAITLHPVMAGFGCMSRSTSTDLSSASRSSSTTGRR